MSSSQPDYRSSGGGHDLWIAAARDMFERLRIRAAAAPTIASGGLVVGDSLDALREALPGYELVEEISRGGQGVVYRARQLGTKRDVAVKVIRVRGSRHPQAEARFEREVQILGQLRHANIVGILDSGAAAGCLYYIMDFIRGWSLDDYFRQEHTPLRRRVELFATICDALSVAHLRGVIHRDLKPGNIRVDSAGQPHVLDFGLARPIDFDMSLAAGHRTETGDFVGSLPWASPEQVAGTPDQLDIRTDVYALGVMLFHALTGQGPYETSGPLQRVMDNICQAEPPRPSTLNRQLDDELNAIVLKCLRKDANARYQSAGDLARELRRYLAGESIEARGDSLAYTLRKQLARHWVATSLAAAFVLVISVGLVVSLALWRQASAAQTEEQKHRERAELEAAKSRAMNKFLIDVLGAADPERGLGPKSTVEELLEAAAAKLDKGALRDEPLVQATARGTLGRTLLRLGLHERAAAQLEMALELRRGNAAPPKEVATSLGDLGMLEQNRGNFEKSMALYREALAVLDSDPTASEKAQAGALTSLGLVLRAKGDHAGAADMMDRAVALDRKTLPPGDPELAASLNNLALVQRDAGLTGEAEKSWNETLAILRKQHGDDNLRVAVVLESLGGISLDRGNVDEAEARQREANAIRERVVGDEHPHVANGLNNLAQILVGKGDLAGAEPLHREALRMRRKLLGEDHPAIATSLNNLALLLAKKEDFPAAEALYREALEIRRRKLEANHPSMLLLEGNLANVVRRSGRAADAEEMLRGLIERVDSAQPLNRKQLPVFRHELGLCCKALGRDAEAESEWLAAYELAAGVEKPVATFVAEIASDLAALYEARGDAAKAAEWRTRATATAPAAQR